MERSGGITFRSVVLGVVLLPVNSIYLVATEVLWASTASTALSLFFNVIFILFWLVLGNMVVRRFRPRWALAPEELLVVYTMLSIASALCSIDMLDILVPTLSHIQHFGELEAGYREVQQHLPRSLVVNDPYAASAYYVGQESIFDPRVFVPWLRPLAIWSLFVFALLAVMGGLILVFRKPWTQHEKLAYPVLQVPMMLVNQTEEMLRNRLFWTGFIAVGFLNILNGLSFFYPLLPSIPVVQVANLQAFFPQRPWSDMGALWVSFYPFAIGLCFFMPLDLSFSCWFFFFFFKMQRVAASHYGIHGMPGFPYIAEQTAGGYYTLALLALWVSRRHIVRMARVLFNLPVSELEPGERRDARLAAGLTLSGGLFLMAFSLFYGMNVWIALFFFTSYFLISLAVTRMRAELGYPSHDLHAIGPNVQIVKVVGAPIFAVRYPRDLVMFGFYNFITRAYRAHPMPHGMEALRISERMKMSHLAFMFAMAVASVVGTVVAFWGILYVFTKYGGSSISGIGEWFGRETWTYVDRQFTSPEAYSAGPSLAMVGGLLFSLGLAVLRLSLVWWPFHPVGYAVSGSWSMEQLWMCFIVAWVIKWVVLKYGGAKAYRRAVPLFLGIIISDFVFGSFWSIFGTFTAQPTYHFWPY